MALKTLVRSALALVALALAVPALAAGEYTLTTSTTSSSTGSNYTQVTAAIGSTSAYSVSAGGSGAVIANGNSSGVYAAPYDTANHQITENYFSTGTSSFTFHFNTAQRYLGALLGSVSSANSISFYKDGVQVGSTLTGNALNAVGSQTPITPQFAAGEQSYFVNILFAPGFSFTDVVFASSSPSFEFGRVTAQAVPEPAMLSLFALGVGGVATTRRRRRA